MNTSILLTGSNGLLGQKIVSLLAGRPDTTLIATARGDNRHPLRTGYIYEDADLTEATRWQALFETYRPDVLIHTAAMTLVDVCEDDHVGCDAINVDAVATLVALCRQYDTHLVHISTDFVFDGAAGPYRESDVPNPVNYYGLSKLRAEQLILDSGLPAAILRTILLYGATPAMSRSNIVLWVKSSLEAGKSIQIVNDQWRSPTLAEDLAAASVLAADQRARGIYHISGPDWLGVHELAYRVADFWQLDASLISETRSDLLRQRAMRPPRTGFVLDKARYELGYRPHLLDEGLALLHTQLLELVEQV
ncbi:MAG: dTDP-4-dehydrorhamnose reductase [Bacteroidia bacterium]